MAITKRITKTLRRMFKAGQDLHHAYKFQQAEREEKALVITQNSVYEVNAKKIRDQWVKPQGFNLLFKILKTYVKKPENTTYYLCHYNWPYTFDPSKEPMEEAIVKAVPEISVDEDGNELVTYNPEVFENVLGGLQLASFCDAMAEEGFFQHIYGKDGNELAMIAIAMIIMGIMIGGILGMFVTAILF